MIIVTWQSPRMADLVYKGEGREFDRLQEGKYIFYEQTTNICYFSKIQLVGQKYREWKNFSKLKARL